MPLTEKQGQTVVKVRAEWTKNLIERGAKTIFDAHKNIATLEDEHLDMWFEECNTRERIEFFDTCDKAERAPTVKMIDWVSRASTLLTLKRWMLSKRCGDIYPQILTRNIIAHAEPTIVTDLLLHTAVSAQNKDVVEQLLADPRVLARAQQIENGQEIVDMLLAWSPHDE
jgi:hypothetical protein